MIIFILIVLIVSCALLLNELYKHTNHYKNQFIDVRKFWKDNEIPNDLQIVNLGSNQPKFGFDYSDSGIKGENFAIGSQAFEYDFKILKKIEHHLSPNAIVVFPVCLLEFFLYRYNFRSIYIRYYTFLRPDEILGYNRSEKFWELSFPLFRHPLRVRYLIKDAKKDIRLELTENPMKEESQLDNDADFWIKCWNEEFKLQIPSLEVSDINICDINKNVHILKEMLQWCVNRGFRPVIVTLPVTKHLHSRFSKAFIQNHILKYIEDSMIDGTPFFNYIGDERFNDPNLFINSFFFNKKGRKAFTNAFVADLKKQGLL